MSFFDKAKAAFASARRVFNRVGTDLLKQATHTGKALVGNAPREIGFAEYMQRMLGPAFINGFERAPVRSANDGRGDTYGAKQRRAKLARKRKGPNYDRVNRELAKFNGMPSTPFEQRVIVEWRGSRRDAITGVVS
jgi:hypothetical protein